jgi:hypothetical protein
MVSREIRHMDTFNDRSVGPRVRSCQGECKGNTLCSRTKSTPQDKTSAPIISAESHDAAPSLDPISILLSVQKDGNYAGLVGLVTTVISHLSITFL